MKKLFCAAVALGLLAAFATPASAAEKDLIVWVDVDGSAYLQNQTDAPLSFDGYQIASETNNLDPAGWKSIQDAVAADALSVITGLGAGALAFGEANPNPGNLSELNLAGSATLPAKGKWAIGKPFKDPAAADRDDAMFFKVPTGPNSILGDIVYVPEPSSFVLGGLGLVGLVGLIRRRRAA